MNSISGLGCLIGYSQVVIFTYSSFLCPFKEVISQHPQKGYCSKKLVALDSFHLSSFMLVSCNF